jgi:hypothetical protein
MGGCLIVSPRYEVRQRPLEYSHFLLAAVYAVSVVGFIANNFGSNSL